MKFFFLEASTKSARPLAGKRQSLKAKQFGRGQDTGRELGL